MPPGYLDAGGVPVQSMDDGVFRHRQRCGEFAVAAANVRDEAPLETGRLENLSGLVLLGPCRRRERCTEKAAGQQEANPSRPAAGRVMSEGLARVGASMEHGACTGGRLRGHRDGEARKETTVHGADVGLADPIVNPRFVTGPRRPGQFQTAKPYQQAWVAHAFRMSFSAFRQKYFRGEKVSP